MADKNSESNDFKLLMAKPEVGTNLTILSGFAFLLVCMILPLVGKAGVQVDYANRNFTAFLLLLLITLSACGLAIKSKLIRSKIDGSPFPYFSTGIGALCLILFISLFLGLLKI